MTKDPSAPHTSQARRGPLQRSHIVAPDERTLHGWFDPALPPVLTVEPGTTVRFGTLDSGWGTDPWSGGPGALRRRHPAQVHAVLAHGAVRSGTPRV